MADPQLESFVQRMLDGGADDATINEAVRLYHQRDTALPGSQDTLEGLQTNPQARGERINRNFENQRALTGSILLGMPGAGAAISGLASAAKPLIGGAIRSVGRAVGAVPPEAIDFIPSFPLRVGARLAQRGLRTGAPAHAAETAAPGAPASLSSFEFTPSRKPTIASQSFTPAAYTPRGAPLPGEAPNAAGATFAPTRRPTIATDFQSTPPRGTPIPSEPPSMASETFTPTVKHARSPSTQGVLRTIGSKAPPAAAGPLDQTVARSLAVQAKQSGVRLPHTGTVLTPSQIAENAQVLARWKQQASEIGMGYAAGAHTQP